MPGACRVGVDIFGSGVILGTGSLSTKIDGLPASVVSDKIAPHGDPPHSAATVTTGSATVMIDGKPATVQGISVASCGHIASTGSATTQIGS